MKVTWEADDIQPGLLTKKPGTGLTGDWMVGYRGTASPARYCIISLADGMLAHEGSTKAELAEKLTLSGHVPAPPKPNT